LRRVQLIFGAILTILAFEACEPEEQIFTTDPEVKLRFSQDTVLFDTVFTSLGSTTRRLTVYNDSKNAVNIASIRTLDSESPFTLTVNGSRGNSFENQRLLGNDSMLVLVDVLIDPMDEDLPFVVEDMVEFETNENLQSLDLVAWGQDAHFLTDSILSCQTTWTADRPYVIYNSVLVDSLCTLVVEAGARIYSHAGSSIYIKGTIDVNGEADQRVLFSNDRFDERYRDAPGQWTGIFFLEGSHSNRIDYTDIRNANYGIWLGTPDNDTIPDLILDGVVIENMAGSGLLGFTSDLYAVNTVVDNCAEYCVGNFAGGNYIYENCTFANLSQTFFRETPLFAVSDNLVLADQSVLVEDISLQMSNTIVWGDFQDEIVLNNDGGAAFEALVAFNILKTTESAFDINNNILNQDPLFINPAEYNYRLDSLSPAIDLGFSSGLAIDLDGLARDDNPDIGAFEWRAGNN
jgi:hypothetical protein